LDHRGIVLGRRRGGLEKFFTSKAKPNHQRGIKQVRKSGGVHCKKPVIGGVG